MPEARWAARPLPQSEDVAMAVMYDHLWRQMEAVASECSCGLCDFAAETLNDHRMRWSAWAQDKEGWAYQPPAAEE